MAVEISTASPTSLAKTRIITQGMASPASRIRLERFTVDWAAVTDRTHLLICSKRAQHSGRNAGQVYIEAYNMLPQSVPGQECHPVQLPAFCGTPD